MYKLTSRRTIEATLAPPAGYFYGYTVNNRKMLTYNTSRTATSVVGLVLEKTQRLARLFVSVGFVDCTTARVVISKAWISKSIVWLVIDYIFYAGVEN